MPTNTNGRTPVVSSGRPAGAPGLPAAVAARVVAHAANGGRPVGPTPYYAPAMRPRTPLPVAVCAQCGAPHKPGKACWWACALCGASKPPTASVCCTPPVRVGYSASGAPAARTAPAGPMPYVQPGSRAPRRPGTQLPGRMLRRPMVAKPPKGTSTPPSKRLGGSAGPANTH